MEGTIGISLIKVRSCYYCSSRRLSFGSRKGEISSPDFVVAQHADYHRFLVLALQGIDEGPEGLKLISDIIREKLEIEVSVLMGANIASEVADEKFCETTIGSTFFPDFLFACVGRRGTACGGQTESKTAALLPCLANTE